MERTDDVARRLGSARPGCGTDPRRADREVLAKGATAPQALEWSWVGALACDDEEFAALVDQVPAGVRLLPPAVLALADVLAGPSPRARGAAHALLLTKLQADHEGTLDLATLVATAPEADPEVLGEALGVLLRAGHPTRAVLLEASRRALRRRPRNAAYAQTVVRSLLLAAGDEEARVLRSTEHEASGVLAAPVVPRSGGGEPPAAAAEVRTRGPRLWFTSRRALPG